MNITTLQLGDLIKNMITFPTEPLDQDNSWYSNFICTPPHLKVRMQFIQKVDPNLVNTAVSDLQF